MDEKQKTRKTLNMKEKDNYPLIFHMSYIVVFIVEPIQTEKK